MANIRRDLKYIKFSTNVWSREKFKYTELGILKVTNYDEGNGMMMLLKSVVLEKLYDKGIVCLHKLIRQIRTKLLLNLSSF